MTRPENKTADGDEELHIYLQKHLVVILEALKHTATVIFSHVHSFQHNKSMTSDIDVEVKNKNHSSKLLI